MAWVVGLLVLAQSLLSLWSARRWLAFVRRYTGATPNDAGSPRSSQEPHDFTPPLSLIVPCRGYEPGLEQNLAAYRHQDYPDYELIFVTAGPEDPACAMAGAIAGARLLYAAPRPDEGEKVTKLRAAAQAVRESSRVLVFADSDGRPGPGWLRELVRPLARPEQEVGAATGYRWFLPARSGSRGLPAVSRAVWNSFIASLLGDHSAVFCWGGSMAVRRETFARLQVEQCWRGSVSDDYRLTAALRAAGLSIRFVPTCLVPNRSDCGWGELFSWTTRQIIITRVYAPRLWALGLSANALYGAGAGMLLWAMAAPWSTALLAAIGLVGMFTGAARAAGACAAMPAYRDEVRRLRWAFILLAPLVPLLMLYNFVLAGLTRTMTWRGTSYRMGGPQKTVVLRRVPLSPAGGKGFSDSSDRQEFLSPPGKEA